MKNRFKIFIGLVILALIVVSCAPAVEPEEPVVEDPVVEEPVVEEPEVEEPVVEEPEEVDVIKVGALLPLTGPDAINGQNQQFGHEFAVQAINEAGGIACLGGAQLQMVYGDSRGTPESGNAETERLITEEDVVAVVGAFHTGVTLPATEIAERYQVPFLVSNALAGAITARGLEYTFKTAVSIEQMSEDSANFSFDQGGAETAAILVPNITFGEEFAKAWRIELPDLGYEVVADIAFPSGASDFQDTILTLRAADPDLIFTISNTADATLMIRQMNELDYWPNVGIVTAAGGYADATLVANLGDAADGLFLTNDWFPNIDRPGALELNEAFKSEYGLDMIGNINTTYAGMFVLADALEVACSTDPDVLAETMRTIELDENSPWSFGWNFMYPAISFDETGFNRYTSNVIAQIQNGTAMVVWPDDVAVVDAIWPVPTWGER